ncbi:MAG: lamin tail domain-containing protein [bacterium]
MMDFYNLIRKFFLYVFLALAGISLHGQNLVTNGDFESWTGGDPDGWTTIEVGIDVTEETTIVHGGSSSASIDVLTGTQGDTDFRQDIAVEESKVYDVSVWVYHTEGHVAARLYVDGYLNYSDHELTGQWQEVTYTYTATATGTIEIGLRFYDQTGFDGEEIVYVDDYVIEEQGGSGGTGTVLYEEGFLADLGTTTTYSVTGAQIWEWGNFGLPPGCATMSGYDGQAYPNEDWLISEAINCNNFENIMLSFDHARNYGDNSQLYVMVSNDYDGSSDPSSNGTWNDITSGFTFPATGSWNFIDAGSVDISSYAGATTFIAFKYTSDDVDAATWEVDNVTVTGELTINAFIAGSFNSWNSSDPDYQMELNDNGLLEHTHTLPAGSNEYKVVEDGNWYPNNNQTIEMTAEGDTTWKYNYEANLVTHTLPVVAGDFFNTMGGNNWDPGELMGEMEDPDGDDIYTLELTIPVAGNYECKVTLNRNWDQSTGGNTPFVSDGVNPTTFTYDFPNNTTSVTGPPPEMATVTFSVVDTAGKNYDGFYLKGSWDGNGFYDPSWGGGMEHSMFYDDGTNGDTVAGDHIWMCQQELAADGGSNTWEWGVNDTEHNWIAGNWTFMVEDDTPQDLEWVVPSEPELLINEIMYNSIGVDQEWVELYNNTGSDIDLENWKLIDSDASHPSIIIPSGYSVPDGGYFTIAVEGEDPFPFTPDYDGRGNFQLNNSGDIVRLYNSDGILVDIVNFTDSDPWPTEPDGDGPSLALIDPATDNSEPDNWAASNEEGGTPGAENFPPQPFVDITYPDGGEFLELGAEYEITWTYGFWDGFAEIHLLKEGEEPQLIASNISISDKSYFWTVWAELEVGDDYKIQVSGMEEGDPVGESDDYFSIIEPYVIPDIVITEIMYNPPEAGEDSLEFLELYNNTAEMVNLEGYSMTAGVDYTFPSIDLSPDGYLLLAKDSMAMLNVFGVTAYQWTDGALSNSGEPVEMADNFGNIVDYVPFSDQLPWDTLADGQGPSLTLCNPDSDNALAVNWTASVNFMAVNGEGDSIFATPGFACQVELLAGFQGEPSMVAIGDSVMFTDQTTGNPVSWMWTFEGGTPGTFEGQSPPYITYNQAGMWDVTLVVSDGNLTDSLTIEDYIVSGMPPTADFEAEETMVPAGSYTNFTSLSTGEDLSYSWYFEGGTPETSSAENPTEIYYLIAEMASYDVTLIVTNPFGTDTLTKADYIDVVPVGQQEVVMNQENVIIYPNPGSGEFSISMPLDIEVTVELFDLRGQRLMLKTLKGSQKIDLTAIEHGMYLLKITDPETVSTVVKRIILR